MKNSYEKHIPKVLDRNLQRILISLVFLLVPAMMIHAQTLSGVSVCQSSSINLSVVTPTAWKIYALYRQDDAGTWELLEAISTGGSNIIFNPHTTVGKYAVYQYNSGPPPSAPIPGTDVQIGTNRWVFANPLNTPEILISGTLCLFIL